MKPYIKPITRRAQTISGEEIEVKVTDKKSDYYREILQEPFYNSAQDKWDDNGRSFHWTELIFLD